MKKTLALLFAFVLVLSLAACGGSGDAGSVADAPSTADAAEPAGDASTAEPVAAGDTIVIGVTNMTLKEAVYQFMNDAGQAKAAEYGDVELNWVSSENDPAMQMSQVENFISQGVDIIVIEPARSDAAKDMVTRCEEAGIPVINLEADIYEANTTLRIAGDTYKVGTMQVEDYLARAGADVTGKAVVLSGSKGDEAAETITQANLDALAEQAPGLEIVVQQFHENWDRQKAMNTMENALTQYGDEIVVVFANNDTMAIGAMKAAENVSMDQDIMFYGSDFDEDSCEMLLAGAANYAVVDRGAIQLGEAIVTAGRAIALGEAPEVTETVDGQDIYWVPLDMVDKDNVKDKGAAKYPALVQ